ncbi:MAG: 4-hydroxythreonine-4-phosphate dehydrogenase PdxA [Verrucomicrobiota bacterium]
MTGWIGISIGDVTGIGPEVTLKALAAKTAWNGTRFLLIGDSGHLRRLNAQLGLNLPLQCYEGPEGVGRYFLLDPLPPLRGELVAGSPAAARAALAWLKEGAERCLRQELDALVTAPVNKEAILRLGHPFIGQTEFLSEISGTSRTAMMLVGDDGAGHWLRVALVTTHVPIKFVSDQLTQSKIEMVIELAAQACRDLDLPRARIGVCGLNPHAGEGGELGTEDQELIAPAVAAMAKRNADVSGPWAADTLFYYAYHGEYDAVVAMYHDQGLVPLKMIGFERGVNWTLGLPFVRTSPDHGTAYNIAGMGKANPSSMQAAMALAMQLARHGR